MSFGRTHRPSSGRRSRSFNYDFNEYAAKCRRIYVVLCTFTLIARCTRQLRYVYPVHSHRNSPKRALASTRSSLNILDCRRLYCITNPSRSRHGNSVSHCGASKMKMLSLGGFWPITLNPHRFPCSRYPELSAILCE